MSRDLKEEIDGENLISLEMCSRVLEQCKRKNVKDLVLID